VVNRGDFLFCCRYPQRNIVGAWGFSKVDAKSPRWLTSKDRVPEGGKRDKEKVRAKGMLGGELDRRNFNSRDLPHHVAVTPVTCPFSRDHLVSVLRR